MLVLILHIKGSSTNFSKRYGRVGACLEDCDETTEADCHIDTSK